MLVGGRGKAGGVKLAGDVDEAERIAEQILGMDIKGITVRKVLVAAAADIVKEFYLAAVLDRAARRIFVMGSAEGGVEIEKVAETNPEAIIRVHADPMLGLLDWQARQMAFSGSSASAPNSKVAVAIAKGLVRTMLAYDADLVEINPLAIVRERGVDGADTELLVCLDVKVTLDDAGPPPPQGAQGAPGPRRGGPDRRGGAGRGDQLSSSSRARSAAWSTAQASR